MIDNIIQNLFPQLQNILVHELRCKKEVESYSNVMEQYPNYPKIWWYNLRHKPKK